VDSVILAPVLRQIFQGIPLYEFVPDVSRLEFKVNPGDVKPNIHVSLGGSSSPTESVQETWPSVTLRSDG
jgi:hypothetical protein